MNKNIAHKLKDLQHTTWYRLYHNATNNLTQYTYKTLKHGDLQSAEYFSKWMYKLNKYALKKDLIDFSMSNELTHMRTGLMHSIYNSYLEQTK